VSCHKEGFALKRIILLSGYLLAIALMLTLKSHYSTATAEQLRWMLDPVAWLVRLGDGQIYQLEPDAGYVRWDRRITIAPACAGVNYLIMVFGLTVAAFLHRWPTTPGRAAWLLLAGLGAYSLTVAVNAIRILAAIALYDHQIAWGWLTPQRLHLLAGTVIYFTALILYYRGLHRIIARNHGDNERRAWSPPDWLPWAWYLTGAIAVPALHLLFQGRPWPGLEYALAVVASSAVVWFLCYKLARR
jgi:exosortase K